MMRRIGMISVNLIVFMLFFVWMKCDVVVDCVSFFSFVMIVRVFMGNFCFERWWLL